jgi:hypothetical protein
MNNYKANRECAECRAILQQLAKASKDLNEEARRGLLSSGKPLPDAHAAWVARGATRSHGSVAEKSRARDCDGSFDIPRFSAARINTLPSGMGGQSVHSTSEAAHQIQANA